MGTLTDSALEGSDVAALEEVEARVLWLATRMIDAANHDRTTGDGVKVGGHQASSASMVSIMTALWFAYLERDDLVSVKPHASPLLHAIQYLLGQLDPDHLTQLRSFGGLQAYPSRTKDPDRVDFSTGSVGLGATAPLFAAATRRYVDGHFSARPRSRFVAVLGDAELDEGNVWEALLDSSLAGLGNVMWVVDLNRQSLDRVVPGIKVTSLERAFEDAGWHVVEVKYGRRLTEVFGRPGGDRLRARIDSMANDEYQSLFGLAGPAVREAVCRNEPELADFLSAWSDEDVRGLVTNLGGHDLPALLEAYRAADAETDRPSVVFAYTVKGWGLEMAGDPLNHSALLSTEQVDRQRGQLGLSLADEWDRFDEHTAAGQVCRAAAERLGDLRPRRDRARPETGLAVPTSVLGLVKGGRPLATQEAFGRTLVSLGRSPVAAHLVTVAPDVAVSTNLGGWINKVGVFAPADVPDFLGENRPLRWKQSPTGQHIELGISEMNFFSMLAQLGLSWDLSDQMLLPVGTVYDPFVCRGLDAFLYGTYNGARFVVAGTPSGVTLAPEGGAHQSTVTASLGVEIPGVTFAEPAYAMALDWLLCDGLARIADLTAPPSCLYLRLSTRPIDQGPFADLVGAAGEDALRPAVLAGGYRLVDAPADGRPRVTLAASGAVLPEVLAAGCDLDEEGVAATVIDITSLDRLYHGWATAQRTRVVEVGRQPDRPHVAELLQPGVPIVTVHDAASHAMAWLGSVHGSRVVPLGVDHFGQSGSVDDLYRHFGIDRAAIVTAALVVLES